MSNFLPSFLSSPFDQITAILDSVKVAIDSGNSFQKWRKDFNPEQFGITKAHAETVYRNALQTQYSVGRWEQAQMAKKSHPYLRYVTINDGRTSECCRALSGIVRPIDDPFWSSHLPPNHHRCRSIVVSLTEKEAQKRSPPMVGLNQPESPQMQPQKGWDYNPALSHGKVLTDLVETKIAALPNASNWFKNTLREQVAKKLEGLLPVVESSITPISNALILPKNGIAKDVAETVLAEIDKIHGVGVLPQIPVLLTDSKDYGAVYRRATEREPKEILIGQHTHEPEFDFTHEIGHFLDHQAIGEVGAFASVSSDLMADWFEVVTNSAAIKEILALPEGVDYRDYYLGTAEMWARSYAQYIATKSQNPTLLKQLDSIRTNDYPNAIHNLSQWHDKDFEPIASKIDQLFLMLGWKNENK